MTAVTHDDPTGNTAIRGLEPNPAAMYRDAHVLRLLKHLATELTAEGHHLAPVVAAAVNVLKTDDGYACPECGTPVAQKRNGRRRIFCTNKCKQRQARRNSRLSRDEYHLRVEGESA